MSPGSKRLAVIYSCWSSVLRRDIWAPRVCAVLDCWRQGIAWQRSHARCLFSCIRALREKENFQLFHFVQPLKMVHFINCNRHKRFSQNEKRRADLQNVASEFLIFAQELSYDLSRPVFMLGVRVKAAYYKPG